MALSDYEKQVIAEMEKQLKKADPSLASVMTSSLPEEETKTSQPGQLSPRRIAIGAILAVVGLAVVILGVTLGFGIWAVLLGVAGFFLMVGGILLALKTDPRKTRPRQSKRGDKPPKKFMEGQQDRWDRHDR